MQAWDRMKLDLRLEEPLPARKVENCCCVESIQSSTSHISLASLSSWASLNLSPSVRSILRCYDTAVEDVSIQTGDRPLSISILRCSEYCRGCLDLDTIL